MWDHRSRPHPLLAAVVAGGCACSFVAVRRPPPSPPPAGEPLRCTQSRVAPVLDTTGAILTPLVGLGTWWLCEFTSVMTSWGSDQDRPSCAPLAWGTLAVTAAYTGSAVYGYHVTGDCRRMAERRGTAERGPRLPASPAAPGDGGDPGGEGGRGGGALATAPGCAPARRAALPPALLREPGDPLDARAAARAVVDGEPACPDAGR